MTIAMLMILVSIFINFVSANLPEEVQFLGRWSSNGADWSGAGIMFHLENSDSSTVNASVNLQASCSSNCYYYVDLSIDCTHIEKILVSPDHYLLNFNISIAGNSSVEVSITKITEPYSGNAVGTMLFESLNIYNSKLLKSEKTCSHRDFKLLVIGDSITAAYGVEGEYPCSFSADTENVLYSYATLVADAINAELHVVAWSGKGVVRNYGDPSMVSINPMPVYYNRTIATSDDADQFWNPMQYQPDIILVMLGTNDYSTDPVPTDEVFTVGFVSLLNIIHEDYPNAEIAAMCAPSNRGNQCKNIQQATVLSGSEVRYVYIDQSAYVSYGCDYHPDIATQENIANVVIPVAKDMLDI